ncbi:hypothetical protein Sru01_22620 [Sphaerisporangium rufum]|uniref:Pentapeptide repeat-containing protein n=1 Tax=Sphaerisporangium rufum TaxID=1381558 RepID=A0A919V4I0_9ACTN|nr:hypothetical protein Sru01_22620 [Sphaerisporangium rufum]
MKPALKIAALAAGWPACDASPDCPGVTWPPYPRCAAHLDPAELARVLGDLGPGGTVDLRGTRIGEDLLARLLAATGGRLGRARFDHAVFTGPARFGGTVFAGDATFDHARFERLASFFDARFTRHVSFREARFAREFSMHGARVAGHGTFDRAHAAGDALFGDARFGQDVAFRGTEFAGFAVFDGFTVGGDAIFRGARFRRAASFRRATTGGTAGFEAARFHGGGFLSRLRAGDRLSLAGAHAAALDVDTAHCPVDLGGARVAGRLTLRLADADLDLRDAVLAGPATVTGRGGLRIVSLDRLDAAALTLDRADLSTCSLAGVRRPEALRLSGCAFAATPRGVRLQAAWPPVRWWTGRRVLADERSWRGWAPRAGEPPDPGRLAGLYERLRQAVDDDRTAADFAFGAMEMRRLASGHGTTWFALSLHWLLCGYGLRMGRAAGWLALAGAAAAMTLYASAGPDATSRPVGHPPPPYASAHHAQVPVPVPAPRGLSGISRIPVRHHPA